MRGTRQLWRAVCIDTRFIPAYAGNAADQCRYHRRGAVHPRVCGERGLRGGGSVRSVGSSPRMRGTLSKTTAQVKAARFIPAYAGNAGCAGAAARPRTVHPRVCGERAGPALAGRADLRFIPAYAGNASPRKTGLGCTSVHPRVCGEREGTAGTVDSLNGSSPRMRGTRGNGGHGGQPERFIPAYAGNARLAAPGASGRSVHPRVCGERTRRGRVMPNRFGSSPRMRGTPISNFWLITQSRFIPAYAGNAYPASGSPQA